MEKSEFHILRDLKFKINYFWNKTQKELSTTTDNGCHI